jgi:hypothetical protein
MRLIVLICTDGRLEIAATIGRLEIATTIGRLEIATTKINLNNYAFMTIY